MELTGKRVVVVGMAASGIASALFLRARKALVVISEMRSASELRQELPRLLEAGVAIETGGHRERTFLDADLIVVSPGVPADLPRLQQARQQNIPVWGEIELASRFLQGTTVAITGANGKTTTTALTGEVLRGCGKRVQVGGNIGVPLITLVESSTPDTYNVVEVSSFQLETIAGFHAQVAAVLNLSPDHLDRHRTMAAYAAAKARIFENQTSTDFALLNHDDPWCRTAAAKIKSQPVWFGAAELDPGSIGASVNQGEVVWTDGKGRHSILPVEEIPLRGSHNLANVLAAVAMGCLIAGPEAAAQMRRAVKEFKAVEHRLEFVASIGGVDYYNDSKATNVDAASKALEAFSAGVWLILGGKDKGSDYTTLLPLLRKRARGVLLIGAATAKISAQISQADPEFGQKVALVPCGTLDQALSYAQAHAQPGDTVLLAPACSSFDQFRNYEQRGEVFKQLVTELALAG